MKKKIMTIVSALLMLTIALSAFSGCGAKLDNESSPLVLATTELDGVFNPFFATSGNDMNVIDMTQIPLIRTTQDAKPDYGEGKNTVALDMTEKPQIPATIIPNDYSNYYTTYEFLIKKGIKFSDGSELSIKDILFCFYVYLDPAYTGSSTMYSTKIKGLQQYRGQSEDYGEYTNAHETLRGEAIGRLIRVMSFCEGSETTAPTEVASDIEILKALIKDELYTMYGMAFGQVESMHEEYSEITKGWEVFFTYFNFITLDSKTKTVKDWQANRNFDASYTDEQSLKDAAVEYVFKGLFPKNITTVKDNIMGFVYEGDGKYWETAVTHMTAVVGSEKYKNSDELEVQSIKGITTRTTNTFNGKTYNENYDVLTVVIDGVDPKAKWNFAIPVVPMKYYTSPALYQEADASKNKFGVQFYSLDFMDTYVRSRLVPIGAGAYQASNGNNQLNPDYKDFFKDGIVYLQRNTEFHLQKPVIKNIRYKVFSSTKLYDAVVQGEAHYAQPTVKKETMEDLSQPSRRNLSQVKLSTLGYGYVGINAKYIPDLAVRQAIMHAMDINLCMAYFSNNTASPIYRSMSKVSWAYPTDITKPYYTYDSTGKTSNDLIFDAGFRKGTDGVYVKGDRKCEFTFTVASDNDDHPAFRMFQKAKEVLEKAGCKVTLVSDKNTLSKLSRGGLSVYAAAFGTTIDPDMYQGYHKDSQATTILNWGYPTIMSKGSTEEKNIINELSIEIERGREYLNEEDRKPHYRRALDLVMELAVELPTYQREDLFVYNNTVIDASTLPKDSQISPYVGILDKIWEISLKV